eukprot:gb/GEZN01006216.1/.p1 GENE.gb/GEZN01006216.1/~~gb/GEZN01006216.1/.p1  ORF type:complete len:310 (+),score=34.63 gb/GEZN01006216.1/:148-1077(+)
MNLSLTDYLSEDPATRLRILRLLDVCTNRCEAVFQGCPPPRTPSSFCRRLPNFKGAVSPTVSPVKSVHPTLCHMSTSRTGDSVSFGRFPPSLELGLDEEQSHPANFQLQETHADIQKDAQVSDSLDSQLTLCFDSIRTSTSRTGDSVRFGKFPSPLEPGLDEQQSHPATSQLEESHTNIQKGAQVSDSVDLQLRITSELLGFELPPPVLGNYQGQDSCSSVRSETSAVSTSTYWDAAVEDQDDDDWKDEDSPRKTPELSSLSQGGPLPPLTLQSPLPHPRKTATTLTPSPFAFVKRSLLEFVRSPLPQE